MKDPRETYRKCMLLLALVMIAGLIALVPVSFGFLLIGKKDVG